VLQNNKRIRCGFILIRAKAQVPSAKNPAVEQSPAFLCDLSISGRDHDPRIPDFFRFHCETTAELFAKNAKVTGWL